MPHVVKPTRSYKNRIHHPGSALASRRQRKQITRRPCGFARSGVSQVNLGFHPDLAFSRI